MDHFEYITLLQAAKANPDQRRQARTVFTNQWLFQEGATPFFAKLNGPVRVGVRPAIGHPGTSKLLSKLMMARNPPVPPEGRTPASICITDLGK
jgi:hypothetical protein